jgi:hypothetical protein
MTRTSWKGPPGTLWASHSDGLIQCSTTTRPRHYPEVAECNCSSQAKPGWCWMPRARRAPHRVWNSFAMKSDDYGGINRVYHCKDTGEAHTIRQPEVSPSKTGRMLENVQWRGLSRSQTAPGYSPSLLLANCASYHKGDTVWLFCPTRKKGKLPKLQSSWEGPHKVVTQTNNVVNRMQQNPTSRMMVVHLAHLAPHQGTIQDEWP